MFFPVREKALFAHETPFFYHPVREIAFFYARDCYKVC